MMICWNFILLFVFLQINESFQSVYDRDRPEEYLGCFHENVENRIFSFAPGDYRASDLSPIQCMVVCGQKYRYAAIQNGIYCMCSNTLPTNSTSETQCSATCPGTANYPDPKPKCGGRDVISVYSVENRILGLRIQDPGNLDILKRVSIQANVSNGKDITFYFNLGDGDAVKPLVTTFPNTTHVYDKPGTYEVKLTAQNNVSGTRVARRWIDVDDKYTGVTINCPSATVIGHPIYCNGTMTRGSRVKAVVDFGDGTKEYLYLNARYGHVGTGIPTHKTLAATPHTKAFSLIVPASEFQDTQRITAWELDASVAGPIKLQIFRPTCLTGEKFCQSKHSCIAQSDVCEVYGHHTCKSGEIYCFHCGRCLPNTQQSMSSCAPYRPYHFQTAPADYTLVYQIEVSVSEPGHHFYNLKPEHEFIAQAGDVIGWTSQAQNSAEVAYSSVSKQEEEAPEFEFPAVTEVGSKAARSSGVRKLTHHILSAHFSQAATFYLWHVYKRQGAYLLSTNISKTLIVYADLPISGVNLTCPKILSTNSTFRIKIPVHNGTNITHVWSVGNGQVFRSQNNTFMYAYPKPGDYTFKLNASNSLSNILATCHIKAFDLIHGLSIYESIAPKPLGSSTYIKWKISHGTNVTYTIDLGDGSPKVKFDMSGKNTYEHMYKYAYASVGHYTVTIVAESIVGPTLTTSDVAIVEITLQGLELLTYLPHVTNNVYAATGDEVTVYAKFMAGNDPKCTYRFQDGSADVTTANLSATHKYTKTGTYLINTSCMNHISRQNSTLNATLVIQDLADITNLTLMAVPTVYGNSTSFNWAMSSGSVFFCDWDFGDGETFKADFSHYGSRMEHDYKAIGDYNVTLSCRNRLGQLSVNMTTSVEIPVAELKLACPPYYVKVDQLFNVSSVAVKGSRLFFDFAFGDGNKTFTQKEANNTLIVRHSYQFPGLFQIKLRVFNRYNEIRQNCSYKVKVEYPVERIWLASNSPLKLNPGIAEFYWYPEPAFIAPTDVIISWKFGDNQTLAPYSINFHEANATLQRHRFNNSGIYITIVTIRNNVSSESYSLTIDVQKMLPLYFKIRHFNPVANNSLPGCGRDQQYYPSEHALTCSVTSQPKDKWFIFNFGDGSPSMNSTVSFAMHNFSRPGKFNVTVTVHNVLQTTVMWQEVIVQESIKNVVLNATTPTNLGENTTFKIRAEQQGTDACYVLKLGDKNVAVFNNTPCVHLRTIDNHNYTFVELPKTNLEYNYTYRAKGFYNISLEASNMVSYANETFNNLEVRYRPCASPDIAISGAGTANAPVKTKKAVQLVLQTNVTFDCKKADSVVFTWNLYKVSKEKMQDESNPVVLPSSLITQRKAAMPFKLIAGAVDPTMLELPERVLPLGLIKVKLTITFESEIHDVSDVIGSESAWLDVLPAPLKVIIKGGVSRAIGYERTLTLDGSQSHDPDFSPTNQTGMKFSWYCRRKEESFAQNYISSNKTSGCFSDGTYNLSHALHSANTHQLDTGKLRQFQEYTIRLVITKDSKVNHFDQSVKVLPGDPPTMEIKCKMNCKDKINPAGRLIVESVCTDCRSDARLFYIWKLFEVTENITASGETSSTSKLINDLESKTTTGAQQANIAIKENTFEIGKVFALRVVAWKAGGNEDIGGFSEYRFTINRPPSDGKCDITPKSGYCLATQFKVTCDDWKDEDMPLLYQADVLRDGNLANMYRSNEKMSEVVLPLGNKDDNYEMTVIVSVEDGFGFATVTSFQIQVKEPPQVDFNAVEKGLTELTESGNVQALAQRAVAAGSVMNKEKSGNDTTANDEAVKARTNILLSVSKVKACELDQMKQMGDVFNEMTGKPDEVSEEAQDASSSSMSGMSDCMLKTDAQDPRVKAAALTMLQGSSKLLEANQLRAEKVNKTANATTGMSTTSRPTTATTTAASTTAATTSDYVTTTAAPPANDTAAKKANEVFDTMDKVGGSFMRQLVAGDKPTAIKMGNMDLQMAQVADDADEESTGFKLPSMNNLFGNQTSDGTKQSVGAMMTSMAKNPFGSSPADDINSNVQGLSLTDASGKPLDLAGQELQMFVKRDLSTYTQPDMHTFDDISVMKVHKFNYTSNDSGIAVEIRPVDPELKLKMFIQYVKRPTVSSYIATYEFPSAEEASKMKKKLPDPFTVVYSNGKLNGTGEYYLGLKMLNKKEIYGQFGYDPPTNYTLRVFESKCKMFDQDTNQWTTNGCYVGPKTTFNSTHCICKLPEETEVPATATTPTYPATTAMPTTTPGIARPIRKIKRVVKRVSFAGGFFVAPNPIDFSKAFAGFANLAENPVCFATVLGMLGVYLILLFWARREDRKDIERAGVTALEDNDPTDRQFYEITVFTGFGSNAATTSKVFIQLSGEDGQSEARELQDSNRSLFQKRGQDVFLVSFEDPIGDLTYLRIWHDNSGKRPSWYLSRVTINDMNTNKKYLFINEAWLAVEEGDGSVEKVLPVAGPEEIASFNHLFYSTTQKNLSDGHIWFSVFIRPPKSRFTRVQRLSCCLTLLYCTMLTNAMFYQVAGQTDPSQTIHVGPFAFSPAQIGVGIMSSLIVFPVNLLIVGVFRSVGPRPTKEEMQKKKSKRFWWLRELFFCCNTEKKQTEFMDIITTIHDNENGDRKKRKKTKNDDLYGLEIEESSGLDGGDIGFKFEKEDKTKQAEKAKKKKKKRQLPYWMKYFAWVLLVMTSFVSAFFVVLYGFQFGKEKSAQFISSLAISFVQDVMISQPIKIVLLGLFIALVVKKPAEEEEEEEKENKKQADEEYLREDDDDRPKTPRNRPTGIIRFQPPPKEKIKAARELRLKELKMWNIVKDIFIYLVFVISLCTVSYTHLDPVSFQFRKGIEDTFVEASYGGNMKFTGIGSREDFWSWLNDTVIHGLFSTHWYNGAPNEPGFTQDLYSNVFGGARIRQLRVKDQSCSIPKQFHNIISICHDWYSWSDEDTRHYDLKWKKVKNESLYNPPASYKSWEFSTSSELNTYPFIASMATYGGGGYVGDLGKVPRTSYRLINDLKKNTWIDQRTRAVFIEVTIYNAQINLFAIMNFVSEFLPTNGVNNFYSIKVARLYTYGGSTQSFTLACQFFVVFFLVLFIYKETKKIYKERKAYFRGFWNWVEFAMIFLIIVTISMFLSRLLLINGAVSRIHDNPNKFVSFNKVANWDDLFTYVMSFVVFGACIKSIRLLQFNKTISILASTLKGSAKPLGAFSIVFVVFFMAYVMFGYIIFVVDLEDYKSFVTAMETTMGLLLGSFEFRVMEKAHRVIGPFYFLSVMLFGVMYILNVFLSIVMDTYADVTENVSKQSKEYEIVDFMIGRFKKFVGLGGTKAEKAELEKKVDEKVGQVWRGRHKMNVVPRGKDQFKYKRFGIADYNAELSKKFTQLDNSLNGFCKDDYAEDRFMDEIIGNQSGVSNEGYDFDYDEMRDEAEYQQDLYEELNKWF